MRRKEAYREPTRDDSEGRVATDVHPQEQELGTDTRYEGASDHPAVSPDPASSNLVVDIYDQMYHLRGPDPKYLEQLAALVDAKMRAVAQHGTTVDSLRVAVLGALNIADELVTLQQQRDSMSGSSGNVVHNIKSRTEVLAEMLDAALDATRKAG